MTSVRGATYVSAIDHYTNAISLPPPELETFYVCPSPWHAHPRWPSSIQQRQLSSLLRSLTLSLYLGPQYAQWYVLHVQTVDAFQRARDGAHDRDRLYAPCGHDDFASAALSLLSK
jgi:hypothetical protein